MATLAGGAAAGGGVTGGVRGGGASVAPGSPFGALGPDDFLSGFASAGLLVPPVVGVEEEEFSTLLFGGLLFSRSFAKFPSLPGR